MWKLGSWGRLNYHKTKKTIITFSRLKQKKQVVGSRGRASGGLALLIKKRHQVELLGTNSTWILIRILNTSPETIIGLFYFKPTMTPEKTVEILEDVFDMVQCIYMSANIIFAGDFNSRIGPQQIDDSEIFEQTVISNERESMDAFINRR